jgi:hypothetical protein
LQRHLANALNNLPEALLGSFGIALLKMERIYNDETNPSYAAKLAE